MDRIRIVSFHTFWRENGLALEVSARTDVRQVLSAKYEPLSVPETLCVMEATFDSVYPGDLVDRHGCVNPTLWR